MTAHSDAVSVVVVSLPTTVWGAQLRLIDFAGPLAERGVILTLAGPRSARCGSTGSDAGCPTSRLTCRPTTGSATPTAGAKRRGPVAR